MSSCATTWPDCCPCAGRGKRGAGLGSPSPAETPPSFLLALGKAGGRLCPSLAWVWWRLSLVWRLVSEADVPSLPPHPTPCPRQEEDGEEPELLHEPTGKDRPVDPDQPQALWPVLLLRSARL